MTTRTGLLHAPTAFPSLSGVVRLCAAVLAEGRRIMRHRREAAMLAFADDRALADIGLTRTDLRDAFAQPVWRDPTALLAERAGERRHSPQAAHAAAAPSRPRAGRSLRSWI